jgi:hypothetical protein
MRDINPLLDKLDRAMVQFSENSDKKWSPEKVRAAESAGEVFKQFTKMLNGWKKDGTAEGSVQELAATLEAILTDAADFKKEVEDFIASVKLYTADARANGAGASSSESDEEIDEPSFGDDFSWSDAADEYEVEEEEPVGKEAEENDIEEEEAEDDEERFRESAESGDFDDDRVVDAWVGYMLSLGLPKDDTLDAFEEFCVDPDSIPDYFKYGEYLEEYEGSILANLEAIFGEDEDEGREDLVYLDVIRQKFAEVSPEADPELLEKAATIVADWYLNEGEDVETINDMSSADFYDDILNLLDAASSQEEYNIVAAAIGKEVEPDDEN